MSDFSWLDLDAGYPEYQSFLVDWVDSPVSHPEVAAAIRKFATFAHDQYQDAVALLVALSTRLRKAAGNYRETDSSVERAMTQILTKSTFLSADERT
ncbi:MAG: hypothetical protein DIU79_03930 [Actinobacteria bacterium]|nr:MAG: hypothetical protein DIU79_03930 [Actinomycetota bacterium]